MKKYYFYCPHCHKEEIVSILPKGTCANIRDGFGTPISHYECPNCYNLDAGFMRLKENTFDERIYYQAVIRKYGDIRGFNLSKVKARQSKLLEAVEAIKPYYDVDKIRPYRVYVWTKGDLGENVFDIEVDSIYRYNPDHKIPKEVMPIIANIQKHLEKIFRP